MTSTYAAFRVDPSLNFDNFHLRHHKESSTSTIANFSRPISARVPQSPINGKLSYAPPSFSRTSSIGSLRYSGPITPAQDHAVPQLLAAPAIADDWSESQVLDEDISFLDESRKSPTLDLHFAIENVINDPINTALQSISAQESPRSASPAWRPDLSLDIKQALDMPSTPQERTPSQYTLSAPPAVASFADFRQNIALRREQAGLPAEMGTASARGPVSFQFLQSDPFHCPLHGRKNLTRPRSAGEGLQAANGPNEEFSPSMAFPTKKQGAPSIMSSRSTRSIRKGFSRMSRMFARGSEKPPKPKEDFWTKLARVGNK